MHHARDRPESDLESLRADLEAVRNDNKFLHESLVETTRQCDAWQARLELLKKAARAKKKEVDGG
jgi:hypothetical protein